jgi:hypothetical protein
MKPIRPRCQDLYFGVLQCECQPNHGGYHSAKGNSWTGYGPNPGGYVFWLNERETKLWIEATTPTRPPRKVKRKGE